MLPPADVPVTAELMDSMHRLDMVEVSVVAPSILHEIALSPTLLNGLRRLRAVVYGGGSLPREAGDAIRSMTNLYSFMGSSEMYSVVTDLIDQEDWEYLAFNEMMGSVLRPHSEGLWELCLVRKPELDLYQGIFATFSALQDFQTKDLYSKHPTKSGLWRYTGRADDIIILTNGEKLNPVIMEDMIGKHPDVEAVLIAGQARFRTALLVEAKNPSMTTDQQDKLRQSLWPFMTEANQKCPSHGRLSRDLVLFTHLAKPFVRSLKGSIQRRLTLSRYEKELNAMYDGANGSLGWSPEGLFGHTAGSLSNWLQIIIKRITDWDVEAASDLFSLGMDSLQVVKLVKEINSALVQMGSPEKISSKTIYSSSTLENIASEVNRIIVMENPRKARQSSRGHDDVEGMKALLSKAIQGLPINSPRVSKAPSPAQMCIMLTGSTGFIGSYIFSGLLASPKVGKIYCVNRSVNAEEHQRAGQAAKALCAEWPSSRVEFLTCALGQENLGLDVERYDELLCNVTHIVHNAWVVDFNLSLDSFGDQQVTGVLELVRFAAKSKFVARLNFVSSISAVMNWTLADSRPIPEQIIKDWSAVESIGYAQSKYVAERLLELATTTAGVPCAVWRVGQVAGPAGNTRGIWNKKEWLPSLIASSLLLGKIPASMGPNDKINWIPVDRLSQIISEILEQSCATPHELPTGLGETDRTSCTKPLAMDAPLVYNLVNPRATSWQSLLPTIQAYYSKTPLETVTLHEWVDALSARVANMENFDELSINPAARLLDFFQSLAEQENKPGPSFDTSSAAGVSKTLRELEPVRAEWMMKWLELWSF